MFIRQCHRQKNGKRHAYWALVESYRTARGPRQRVVSYLGQVDESLRCGLHNKASGKTHQRMLFDDVKPQWVEININNIRVENCLDFGGPWLGLELLTKLGLPGLFEKLMPAGRQDGRRYIIGTPKSMLKKFEAQLLSDDWDKVYEDLEVKRCQSPDGDETFILS